MQKSLFIEYQVDCLQTIKSLRPQIVGKKSWK